MEPITTRIRSIIRYVNEDAENLLASLAKLVQAANDRGIHMQYCVDAVGVRIMDATGHLIGNRLYSNGATELAELAEAVLMYLAEVDEDVEAVS